MDYNLKKYDKLIDKLFIKDKNGNAISLTVYGCLFFSLLGFKLIDNFLKKRLND